MKTVLTKCLVAVLTLALLFGQGFFASAFAQDGVERAPMQQTSVMPDHDCCPSDAGVQKQMPQSGKADGTMKDGLCASACAAMVHAVMPLYAATPLMVSTNIVFGFIQNSATDVSSPPEAPPPKA